MRVRVCLCVCAVDGHAKHSRSVKHETSRQRNSFLRSTSGTINSSKCQNDFFFICNIYTDLRPAWCVQKKIQQRKIRIFASLIRVALPIAWRARTFRISAIKWHADWLMLQHAHDGYKMTAMTTSMMSHSIYVWGFVQCIQVSINILRVSFNIFKY